MKRFILAPLAALFALVIAVAPAAAQNIYPYQQPGFRPGYQTPLSPYLNLLIPGNTAVNYYALVEPQFQRRQQRNVMNNTIQALANQIPPPPGIIEDFGVPMPSAGHPTGFNYTGSYFNSASMGQAPTSPFPQQRQRAGAAGPGQRPGMRGGQMGMGMGGGGMGGGGMGGGGVWPNMRPQMGGLGR